MSPEAYRQLVLLGLKMTSEEALKYKIIDQVVDRTKIQQTVNEFAEKIAEKSRFKKNFQALKKQMYEEAFDACYNKGFLPEDLEVRKPLLIIKFDRD